MLKQLHRRNKTCKINGIALKTTLHFLLYYNGQKLVWSESFGFFICELLVAAGFGSYIHCIVYMYM